MLDIEPEIVDRLTEQLGGAAHVLTAPSLAQVVKGAAPAPAVCVVYVSGQIAQADEWRLVQIRQRWWAICYTRYADATGSGSRGSAGTLARSVFDALAGWQPASASRPLLLSDLPRADYMPGAMLLPLEFETEIELTMGAD